MFRTVKFFNACIFVQLIQFAFGDISRFMTVCKFVKEHNVETDLLGNQSCDYWETNYQDINTDKCADYLFCDGKHGLRQKPSDSTSTDKESFEHDICRTLMHCTKDNQLETKW